MIEIFNTTLNSFTIFQFPDTLPGKSSENDDEDNDQKLTNESVEISNLHIRSKTPKLYSLDKANEGLVGKIVRLKSGSMKFLLGDSVYNIDRGISAEFQQNVVTIDTCIENRSTNFYNLGPIKSNFVCTPDWKFLFQKINS